MKFLLFDENAISTYVSESRLQSVEYVEGMRFIDHICNNCQSEFFHNTMIDHIKDGILFVGRKNQAGEGSNGHIFCIDLTACQLLSEETNPARILTVIQRAFRATLKIWNAYPFSASERVSGSKSIVFPFSISDHHRLVIERSNSVQRFETRGIVYPLLAYKYNAEDPGQNSDIVKIDVLRMAGEAYAEKKYELQNILETQLTTDVSTIEKVPFENISAEVHVEGGGFIFQKYEEQMKNLTESQRKVVENPNIQTPLRVEGAAGTGKTISLIMRAYRLLTIHKAKNLPFHIIFFAHSQSTSQRNKEIFSFYKDSEYYLSAEAEQSIKFMTLLDFCCEFAHIEKDSVIEANAADAKTYQLMMIDDVIDRANNSNRIKTYRPLISAELYSLFDPNVTDRATLIHMLQHEFSVQIKGRTDCSIESYLELEAIPNGIPCRSKAEKEFIFSLFTDYQTMLQTQGSFDVDDVTIEAISHLNAPIWRRNRLNAGYEYIIVDEMHLFNLNEQSVFHFLSKDFTTREIPICFALDYSQAIGDRGDISKDYISNGSFEKVNEHRLLTLFRNSPPIADFCASIAASGTLMFGESFSDPYASTQYHFTHAEELKMQRPVLHMYSNDDTMLADLGTQLGELMKTLQCKPKDIAIITFDDRWASEIGRQQMEQITGKKIDLLDNTTLPSKNHYILASPYEVNGLEFQAVIMLGVDEGRVPQTTGTSDISYHFLAYSAYNMLYLSASRAKYRVLVMGSDLRGVSSCLTHSIETEVITVERHAEVI